MEKLKELRSKKEKKLAEMQALVDAATDGILSDEAQAKFDSLKAETETINKNIANIEQILASQAEQQRDIPAPPAAVAGQPVTKSTGIHVPAEAKKWSGGLKAFKGSDGPENAYKAGMWFSAAFGNEKAKQWCANHGIEIQAVHQGGVNTTGGYLVPEILSTAIIELVKEYGTFRANANIVPMTSDTIIIPRRTGGLTGYFVNEGGTITESTAAWDNVKLIAKDYAVITRISNQLASDAIISVMDKLTTEIARSFAQAEDECGWVGDGTGSTYGGMVGLQQKFYDVKLAGTASGSVTTTKSLVRYGTGYDAGNMALSDLVKVMGLLPKYARLNAKWFTNPYTYWTGMVNKMSAAGGVTMTELIGGVGTPRFMGYPVVLCESIPASTAANQIVVYFGDLSLSSSMGDRQQMAIASSDSASVGGQSVFERNQIALRGVERFDINNHDIGTATTAGPIVGLIAHTA
jgi:HK97 family phage major capsid protein